MNALATDQARRLAKLIFDNSELRGYVTAGLYLGQDGPDAASSAVMTATELISSRDAMRASASQHLADQLQNARLPADASPGCRPMEG